MERRTEFISEIALIFLPLLGVMVALAAVLKLLDAAPDRLDRLRATLVERTPVTRIVNFETFEEAEKKLGVAILIPAYFPDYLTWPPASIYAQQDPLTISLIVRSADLREGLIIRQSFSKTDDASPLLPEPFIVLRRSSVELDERTSGVLVEGKDSDGTPRNQLYWRMRDRQIDMVTTFSASELLRMAQSVHSRSEGD